MSTSPATVPTPRQRSGRRAAARGEATAGILMAAPVVVLIATFLIAPFLLAFYYSFTNQRLVSPHPAEFVGTRNYQRLLTVRTFTLAPLVDETTGEIVRDDDGAPTYPRLREFTRNNPDYPQLDGLREWTSWQVGTDRVYLLASDVVFMKALMNTLTFVAVVAVVQAGLALLLALLVNQRLPFVNVYRAIYFMPVIISLVVVSMLWLFILDGNDGLLNSILGAISFGAIPPVDWLGNPRTALPAIMIMSVWQGVGFHMVIWLSGLQTIPTVLYEAASISGANAWQKFRYVTWPSLRSTAILILVVITMQAFGLFSQVDVMTRGGPVDATQSLVFQAVQRGYDRQDIAGGSAISVLLFLMVASISVIQRLVTRERR